MLVALLNSGLNRSESIRRLRTPTYSVACTVGLSYKQPQQQNFLITNSVSKRTTSLASNWITRTVGLLIKTDYVAYSSGRPGGDQ